MNNKSRGSRNFPNYRDQDFSNGRSERYLGMPERLSYEQILRSRSTISFDRGRPYDPLSLVQENNDRLYGRGRDEGRYGRDSFRLDPNRPDLTSQSFRTDPDSQLNPLYPGRDILERERLSALRNRNLHMSEDSGSSFQRSRPMDTPVPKSYRENSPDVDSLRKKFQNHIMNEMLELSQELPPSRFGLRLGSTQSRRDNSDVDELTLGSQLRNSQALEVSSGKSIAISSSDLPMWEKESHSRDSLWNNDRTSAEFLGGKEKAPYPVGVRVKDLPPEHSPWDNERAQFLENRLRNDGQGSLFPVIKDPSNLKVPFSEDAMWNIEGTIQSAALQKKAESPQLSLDKTSAAATLSTEAEPNDFIDASEPSNHNPNNPVYSDAYISDLVCRQPESRKSNSTEPSLEDGSQKFAKEDPIPFDQYPVYSIPFLGETVSTSNTETASKSQHEKILNQVKPDEEDSILSNSSHSKTGENDKMKSTLEDALETLMLKEPIVGLDYIIEYKDIVSSDGGFPFYCNLCKSSISRSLIIDHVKGFKHGLKYLKTKNENASEYVLNHVKNQAEKEDYVYKAMEHLEKAHGKGNVVVKLKSAEGKQSPLQIHFGKVHSNIGSPISELEESSVVKPITLAKIDEMSQDSNLDGACFLNEENSSRSSQQNSNSVSKEPKGKDETNFPPIVKVDKKINESEEKVTEIVPSPLVSKRDLGISSPSAILENKSLKRPADEQLPTGQVKMHKTEVIVNLDSEDDIIIEEVRLNNFNVTSLDKLTRCSITNDEEANVVRKVVETLLKLLLQYNLRHIANEDRTRLITEVQSRPLQTMEKLQELLKLPQPRSGKEDEKLRLNSDFSIRVCQERNENAMYETLKHLHFL